MVATNIFTLPWPPSVNRYWRIGRGRVFIAKEGIEYREKVFSKAGSLPVFHRKRLCILIQASPPDKRMRDLDNTLKATLDAMQNAGVYDNDEQIDDLRITRLPPVRGGRLLVSIFEVNNGAR